MARRGEGRGVRVIEPGTVDADGISWTLALEDVDSPLEYSIVDGVSVVIPREQIIVASAGDVVHRFSRSHTLQELVEALEDHTAEANGRQVARANWSMPWYDLVVLQQAGF